MTRRSFLLTLATLALGVPATFAGPVYRVTLNTTPFSGTSGFVDLAFNQANLVTSGPATASISNFISTGFTFTGGDQTSGAGVTGTFGAPPIVIANDVNAANYYSIEVTFGTGISFDVMLAGGALTGGYSDPSAFLVTLYDNTFGYLTAPLANSEVANIVIAGNGGITTQGSTFNTTGSADVTELPEPATLLMSGVALGLAGLLRMRLTARV